MSRDHSSSAGDVTHIINDISKLTEDEVEQVYGIILSEDGSVFDPTYRMSFETVGEWATFSVEQDDVEYEEHFQHGGHD